MKVADGRGWGGVRGTGFVYCEFQCCCGNCANEGATNAETELPGGGDGAASSGERASTPPVGCSGPGTRHPSIIVIAGR